MSKDAEYNRLVIKLADIEDKVLDINKVAQMIEIRVKDNDYELIPIVKILNNKVKTALKIIEN